MFKAHDRGSHGDAQAAHGGPSLSHTQMLADEPTPKTRSSKARLGPIKAFEAWCARVDLAPDLASDIGSRKWLRGLTTMVALGAVAIAQVPSMASVEPARAAPITQRVREQFRSQTITPLALGADSGRHMGASPLVRPLASVPERPRLELVSTLGQGDSFAGMLGRVGLGQGDIAQVQALIAPTIDPSAIEAGTQFEITLGKRPQPGAPRALEALDFRARFDLDLSVERAEGKTGGAMHLVPHPIRVDATPLRIRGKVGSSLYRSARAAGAPVSAIQAYLRAIDKQLSLDSDIQPDDEFDMIVAYKRSAKGDRQVGDLLYAGVVRDGKPRLQMLRWGKDGAMFAANSVGEPRSVPVGAPVAGRITSPYGMRRHPILGIMRMHAGIDFGAPYGSPIHAVAAGTVTYAGRHGGHGNFVRIKHAGGLGTGYAHMSRIAVAVGAHVNAGQVIGYVGSTGLSTGPHLHFEAYRNGHTINPAGLKIMSAPQLDAHERDAYKARMASLLRVEPGAALANIAKPEAKNPVAEREIDRLEPEQVN